MRYRPIQYGVSTLPDPTHAELESARVIHSHVFQTCALPIRRNVSEPQTKLGVCDSQLPYKGSKLAVEFESTRAKLDSLANCCVYHFTIPARSV